MNITDRNMFRLLEILRARGDVRFEREFCEVAGIIQQNFSRIKNGTEGHSFTIEQIYKVCREYRVNVNWIFGFERQIFRGADAVNSKVNTVNPKEHTVSNS